MFHVATFYHFIPLADLKSIQADLLDRAEAAQTCGTFLIAPEGLNATTASANEQTFKSFIQHVMDRFQIPPDHLKWSTASAQPFKRLKIRIKKETITMNRGSVDVVARTGRHVPAEQWNALVQQNDILVLDTRNTYETEMGTFKGAVVPPLKTFTDFANYVDQMDPAQTPKIAMFCTGGIRCEKASSYMLEKGFPEVYQLQGGILKYLETIPPDQSLWNGTCFVFDERGALGHGLAEKKT